MLSQAIVIISFVAVASAGLAGVQYVADPHVGAQAEHTVRGFGGLSSVSQQHKTVASPFSSVSKTDVRVTNDAAVFAPAGVAYTQGYAAPVAAAPVAYATQAYSAAPVHAKAYGYQVAPAYAAAPVAYAAPAYAAAPVVAKSVAPAYAAAPVAYAAPAYAAAPVGYAAPIAKVHSAVAPAYAAAPVGYAAPIAKVHSAPLLGVAYSAVSPAVATLNFNGYGISYGY